MQSKGFGEAAYPTKGCCSHPIHSNIPHPLSTPTPCFSHRPLSDSDHTMEIWFECTTSGQRCAAEVGEGCSAADLQERAVAVLYPQSVVSAEAVGLCVDGADGEVLAPEVLIAHTALCAGGTVHVSRRKQDSSGVWVPKRYNVRGTIGDVCKDTLLVGGEQDTVTINLVTTKVTPLPPKGEGLFRMVLMPHHFVYRSSLSLDRSSVHFRPRDSGAEVVVPVRAVRSLVAMCVTETVLIGTSEQIVQYSCEGVKMRTIDHSGYSFAVSPCETLLLNNGYPTLTVYRLDTPELSVVHRVDTGLCRSFNLRPSFSSDASLAVLSCGDKHTVRTIDIVSGQALCTLPSGGCEIHGACFSACSRYLFTASDRSVQQWDARSGALMASIDVYNAWSVHASRDGCRLVVVGIVTSVLDIAASNMQVSEQDALQHGPPRPLPIPSPKRTVVATESRCSGCVCS